MYFPGLLGELWRRLKAPGASPGTNEERVSADWVCLEVSWGCLGNSAKVLRRSSAKGSKESRCTEVGHSFKGSSIKVKVSKESRCRDVGHSVKGSLIKVSRKVAAGTLEIRSREV